MRENSIGYEAGGPTRTSTQDGRRLVVHEVIDHCQRKKWKGGKNWEFG